MLGAGGLQPCLGVGGPAPCTGQGCFGLRQVDDSPGQTEEGAAAAPVLDPVVKLEPRDGADLILGPEDLELIEGLSLEPGAMEQLEESLALAGESATGSWGEMGC